MTESASDGGGGKKRPPTDTPPVPPKPKREFGAMRGKFAIGPEFFEPLPPEELDLWYQ
ncbi:hypothetical protein D3C83_267260 [compost metagenome]